MEARVNPTLKAAIEVGVGVVSAAICANEVVESFDAASRGDGGAIFWVLLATVGMIGWIAITFRAWSRL